MTREDIQKLIHVKIKPGRAPIYTQRLRSNDLLWFDDDGRLAKAVLNPKTPSPPWMSKQERTPQWIKAELTEQLGTPSSDSEVDSVNHIHTTGWTSATCDLKVDLIIKTKPEDHVSYVTVNLERLKSSEDR